MKNVLISASTEKTADVKQVSLQEMFKPKAGTWTCQTCMIQNGPEASVCVACSTRKPGWKPSPVKEEVKPSIPKTKTDQPSLAELFKPKSGSWSCEICLVTNDADKLRCVACCTLKPGVKAEDVKQEGKATTGGLQFGTQSTGTYDSLLSLFFQMCTVHM